jgi:hypothetical protein
MTIRKFPSLDPNYVVDSRVMSVARKALIPGKSRPKSTESCDSYE